MACDCQTVNNVYEYISCTSNTAPSPTISSLKSNAKGPHCDKARVLRTARLIVVGKEKGYQ